MNFKSLLFLFLFFISCGKSPLTNSLNPGKLVTGVETQGAKYSFSNSNLSLSLFFRTPIIIGDEVRALVIITDGQGVLVDPKMDLDIWLWMPTMGHGSFPIEVSKVSVGTYELKDMYFTMNGLWDLHFDLKDNGLLKHDFVWSIDL